MNRPLLPADSREALARDMGAVAGIGAVPSILKMICDETGMGFAAVARVTDSTWTACAVQDNINFGLVPGGQLELRTTLCSESRASRAPIIVDRFSSDTTYRDHHTPAIYGLESYISVPIVLPDGEYFGNLCAVDPRPAKVSEPRVVRMFEVFANLIGMQLASEKRQWSTEAQLFDERETAHLREQFIAVLGHDLRNPLSAVSANGELLSRRKSEPDLVGIGNRLKATAARMARLIDDVLDLARGRLGSGMSVSIVAVDDIAPYLRAVVDELCVANPSRAVNRAIQVDSAVSCDLVRIQQLLSNLLGNAMTHGGADTPVTVEIAVERDHLTLSVTNGGEPIAPETLSKVFEPYWRPATSAPGGGLGLGLYICKQIVSAHGGTLGVESSAEIGTRFTARIPVRARDAGF
ncbi:GAF domain-containing sensor histidine kinase [Caballeronia sp. LP006]|uniref:GAF domain-containing sensor histidine kinase n=1 Tax=unclassified Caballeronia TaxID=2646786 RepID=UPI002866C5BD|nr:MULTISPECIES: GAF domain-containing sensor histidine kinase [unclassified Caballeronia]MDR5774239.1 GAF domain-containing sensor histidine kinase [Caballeronia sp. LZ002]MDR5827016.1 GAF domain-containing sensor histidine kinase [Caballeronia sp. LP006]MDR5849674.1 GAF domain-containing sensor histidine kinase [Caballeronia sp. LZ003]